MPRKRLGALMHQRRKNLELLMSPLGPFASFWASLTRCRLCSRKRRDSGLATRSRCAAAAAVLGCVTTQQKHGWHRRL